MKSAYGRQKDGKIYWWSMSVGGSRYRVNVGASSDVDAIQKAQGQFLGKHIESAMPYYPPAARGRCRDCGVPGPIDTRGFGFNCGCALE